MSRYVTECKINWDFLEAEFESQVSQMKACPQDPKFHEEGDVWTHLKMVMANLEASSEWATLNHEDQEILVLSTFLHDVGKPSKTEHLADGSIGSKGHAAKGEKITRCLLRDKITPIKREHIAKLVRLHGLPSHPTLVDADRTIIRASFACRLDLLCLLSRADIKGRMTNDCKIKSALDNASFFEELCRELECINAPRKFLSPHSRFMYFRKSHLPPTVDLYDDTEFEVILLSGLPGAGKDFYISNNYPDLPMVSLDELREDMDIDAIENQGKVVQAAYQKAKELLRKKESFVFNATNVTRFIRYKWINLFYRYHASTKVVYLEPSWNDIVKQNKCRQHPVPEHIICDLFTKVNLPDLTESHKLEMRI